MNGLIIFPNHTNIIDLIKKYPTAMKRPLITDKNKVLAIGFDENIYKEKIK